MEKSNQPKAKDRHSPLQWLLLFGAIVTGFVILLMYPTRQKNFDTVKLENIGSYPFSNIVVRANGDTVTIPFLPAHSSKTVEVNVVPEASLQLKFTDHLGREQSEPADCYLEGDHRLMHLTIDSEGKIQVLPDSYGLPLKKKVGTVGLMVLIPFGAFPLEPISER